MEKRLYRSENNYVIAGVAGGMGEYFDIDPTLVRLAFILFTLAGGTGVLVYILLMIVLPKRRSDREVAETKEEKIEDQKITHVEEAPRRNTLALVLIGIGLVSLLNQAAPLSWLTWDKLWPIILIGAGLYFIFRR